MSKQKKYSELTEEQKELRREIHRKWAKANPEKAALAVFRSHKANPESVKAANGKYLKNNPEKLLAFRETNKVSKRKKYITNPVGARESAWKSSGIDMSRWSWKQYLVMLEEQQGRCIGCSAGLVATKAEGKEDFEVACVDHDHSNGRVRGLLCNSCNRSIGWTGDNIVTVENLLNYLKRSKGQV